MSPHKSVLGRPQVLKADAYSGRSTGIWRVVPALTLLLLLLLLLRMKVKVKRVNAVAVWKWNVPNDDVCGICRVAFDGCCPDCHIPGDDCPILTGQCNHVFHMYFIPQTPGKLTTRHCIEKWLHTPDSKQQCPMDRQPWGTTLLM
jgi:anaphase-promoting complex subunit 11